MKYMLWSTNETKNRHIIAAMILAAVFVWPFYADSALTLPTTTCNPQWVEMNHLGEDALEDGTKAFTYGSDNNNFVSASGDVLTFKPNLLFSPDSTAVFKVYALNQNCSVIYGDTSPVIIAGENTITFDKQTYDIQFNTEEPSRARGGLVRYLGFDVWDGKNTDSVASYSYLVDIENIENPILNNDDDDNNEEEQEEQEEENEPAGPRPVLIIPGIMGSELYEGGELVWPDIGAILDHTKDLFLLEGLSLDDSGNSIKDINLRDIIKKIDIPLFGVDIFDDLIFRFNEVGYKENTSYYTFPYDWRLDLNENGELLTNKIEEIKTQSNFDKIDIIAHSMGGLLVKDYISHEGSSNINKLIFVGTPHLGAPKAAKTLLTGDTDFPFNILNRKTIKQLSLNMPSIYQLLPNQKYFEIFRGYIDIVNSDPQTLAYESSMNFLKVRQLNAGLVDKAEEFFDQMLHELDLSSIDTYNIIGCGINTQAGYRFTSATDSIKNIAYTSGDKTVPFMSARYLNISNERKYYVKGVRHSELPSHTKVRTLILDILGGNNVSLDDTKISNGTAICDYKGKQLTWKSPVEVHIYDQNGNHAGPTAGSGFENNLTGVDYEIINGEKFIFIPTDDGNIYSIEAMGEGEGTFDLIITDIDNGNALGSVVYNDIEITSASQIDVNLTGVNPVVEFDYSGSGSLVTLQASATLDANEASDLTAPETTNSLAGTHAANGNYLRSATITLNPTDDLSGILQTKFAINNNPFQIYDGPVTIGDIGSNKFKYYSIDNAGNNEVLKTLDFTVELLLSTPGGSGASPTPVPTPASPGRVLGETKENSEIKRKLETPKFKINDGALILDTTDGRTVYMIGTSGKKYGFTSEEIFLGLGYSFEYLVNADLSDYELGGLVDSVDRAHPDGSLVVDNSGTVWFINHGKRKGFVSMDELTSFGFSIKNIIKANDFDLNLPEIFS